MKVLYIHGYNSNANSSTAKLFQKVAGEKFEVHTIEYNQEKPIEALNNIRKYIKEFKIDLVIGTSLGGFLTMNLFGFKRIAINPCFLPSVELTKIGYEGPIDEYKELENELKDNVDETDWDSCLGCFAPNDELLGLKYKEDFDKVFQKSKLIPGGHRATEEAVKKIVNEYIPDFLNYIQEWLFYYKGTQI